MANAQLDGVLRHLHSLRETQTLAAASDAQLLERFTARHEEAAFTALLRRHGPMVLGVSRRVLHRVQDAEDVFQATFLLLARKASSIRKRASVGCWLHGVAHRLAVKAKAQGARRQAHEKRAADMRDTRPSGTATWQDVQAALDVALQELPEHYRAALVLCYLEGKSHAEAAQSLGCPLATVRTRVARGRKVLRNRLTAKGLTLSTAGLAALLIASAAPAAAPAALVKATVRAALPGAAGQAAGTCSARVAGLIEGGLKEMVPNKVKLALLLAACLVAGAALTYRVLADDPAAKPPAAKEDTTPPAAPAAGAPADDKGAVGFSGQVVDPDGKPVKNAKVFLSAPLRKGPSLPLEATTGADGRYRFTVRKDEFQTSNYPEPWKFAAPVALADGYALGLPQMSFDKPWSGGDMLIKLVRDDVPITGRILDLQGKPVAGVRVRVRGIQWPAGGDLTDYLKALKARKEGFTAQNELLRGIRDLYHGRDLDGVFPPVVSDAEGRFRIRGIGPERVADLLIDGPTVETKYVYALTRPGERIEVPAHADRGGPIPMRQPLYTHYPATFDHIAPPSKPVVGTVRDKDTGQPIAGVVVRSTVLAGNLFDERAPFRAVTDKDGRYRLTGLPRGRGSKIQAGSPPDQPYLAALKELGETPGLEPVPLDFTLKRGVWVHVTVTDQATGKPVPCGLSYTIFTDNPHLKEVPDFTTESHQQRFAEDGTFRLACLPGRGLLGVVARDRRYRLGVGADKIKGMGTGIVPAVPYYVTARTMHALTEVNPDPGAEPVTVKMTVDAGRSLTGTVIGPDGQPLAGALVSGLNEYKLWEHQPLKTAEFTVTGLSSDRSRLVQVFHQGKGLAGFVLARPDEKGPLVVKLTRAGTVTGRVVTPEGNPVTRGELLSLNGEKILPDRVISPPPDAGSLPRPVRLGKDGKFRIEGLAPGLKYTLSFASGTYLLSISGGLADNLTVKAGEVKDLGDVTIKPIE
jgi:RNA polymerase sigma factor (sigma-70 family)